MSNSPEYITDPDQRERLCKNIRALKAVYNTNSNSLADIILVSPSIVSKIETMNGKLHYVTVERLAQHFRVSVDDLLNKTVRIIFENPINISV